MTHKTAKYKARRRAKRAFLKVLWTRKADRKLIRKKWQTVW